MRLMDPVWRRLTSGDAAALAELGDACEAVEGIDGHSSAEEIAEELDSPMIDAQDGAFGAFVDGRLVAAGMVYSRTAADPVHGMFFWGRVRPEFRRRGLGTEVVDRALAAGARITGRLFPDAQCELRAGVDATLAGDTALLEARGFTTNRYEFAMELPFAGREPRKTGIPDGFTLLNFEDALSEEFRETHNIAFVPDHPGSTVQTVESWPHVMGIATPGFRADLSFGLRDTETGTLAGYVMSRCYESETAATGRLDLYLNYIGTRREYRGRGLASTLIDTAVEAAAAKGFDSASLGVYADNPSGALGVYERAGFRVRHRIKVFTRLAP
jgi:mycothiol synthase